MKFFQWTLTVAVTLALTACGQPQNPTGAYGYQAGYGAYGAQQPYGQVQQPYGAYAQPQTQQYAAAPQQQGGYGYAAAPQQQTLPSTEAPATPAPRASTPATTAKTTTKAPATTAKTPVKTASTAAPKVSVADNLINQTRGAFDKLQSFVATGEIYEKNEKGPVKGKIKVVFQKPGTTKLEFTDHTVATYKGAKLVYTTGTGQVQGRPGGVLSFMSMTLPITDDKLTSRRGYKLDQVDTLAIVTRLMKSGLQVKVLGKTTVNGREVAVMEYVPQNHFDPKVTRELLGVDMQDHFVRIHEMYAGDELVYSLKLTQVSLDQPIGPNDLKI